MQVNNQENLHTSNELSENPESPEQSLKSIELQQDLGKVRRIGEMSKSFIRTTGAETDREVSFEVMRDEMEKTLLEQIHGLPESLALLHGIETDSFLEKANTLIEQISQEEDPKLISDLQIQLIYQYIAIIGQVQNGGDKGFIPPVAKEVEGLDCSLSAWSLKEKLESGDVGEMDFKFGYPPGHAVAIITIADGRTLYVDAQNGFVEEVELEEEQVSAEDSTETTYAYPIYRVVSSRRLTGYMPDGKPTTRTRTAGGSDYVPMYLGVSEDGLMHTLGNMHMLANPLSPTFFTETAKRFRKEIGMPEMEGSLYVACARQIIDGDMLSGSDLNDAKVYQSKWEQYYAKFKELVEEIRSGKTIEETKFAELEEEHHKKWLEAQS